MILEVVATRLEDIKAAEEGGADRIELAEALTPQGAVTASIGFMEAARRLTRLPLYAMIRPHFGPSIYDEATLQLMERDIEAARATGMDGVVVGALEVSGRLDVAALRRLKAAAGSLRVVASPAFDQTPDLFEALDILVDLGFERVITSGGKATAFEGRSMLGQLLRYARGRISIMPGIAVTLENVQAIVESAPVVELHVGIGVRTPSEHSAPVDPAKVRQFRGLFPRKGAVPG